MKFALVKKIVRGPVIVLLALALGFTIVFGGDWVISQVLRLFAR